METKVTNERENVVSIGMTIPAREADAAYNTAATRISQRMNIPGFRQGKAPKAVVERHVGVDRIQHEALELVLQRYINQAIYDNKLDIITQPALTGYNFVSGKDLEVTLEVEVRPEVHLGSYKDLSLKAEIPTTDKKAMDNAIESFLNQNASLELVLDRPSSDTDIVVFDFDGTCNGEKIQGGSAKGYALDLAHSNLIPGFAEQLVGHNIKEQFDITVKFPEDYHDEKLKGQDATFSIKLNEIKQRVIPELTDDLVKKSSQFSTIDELKEDIQKYLDDQRESMKRSSAQNAVFKSINESTSVDIPQSMVNREVNALASDYRQRLSAQGVDWNGFIQSRGGENAFVAALSQEARIRIKNSLIIDKISKEENITVDQSDFNSRLSQMSAAYGVTPEQLVRQIGNNQSFITSLSQQIINDKVRSFLMDNNSFEYVEVKPKKTSKSKEKSESKSEETENKSEEKVEA